MWSLLLDFCKTDSVCLVKRWNHVQRKKPRVPTSKAQNQKQCEWSFFLTPVALSEMHMQT